VAVVLEQIFSQSGMRPVVLSHLEFTILWGSYDG